MTKAILPAAALAAALLPGCNIVGPIAAIAQGPPTREAEYELADVRTVIYVDDRANNIMSNPLVIRREIADRIAEDLIVDQVHTSGPRVSPANMVRPGDAMTLAEQRDRAGSLMPMDEIGRAVGAEQFIYVEVVDFRLSPDDVTPRPTATVNIRVLDLVSRDRRYPESEDGRVINVLLEEMDPQLYQSRSSRMRLSRSLAQATGKRIGQLFYKHEPKELGGRLTPK